MNIFSSISNGLAYLHSKHILLRNLRIENIVKLNNGNWVIGNCNIIEKASENQKLLETKMNYYNIPPECHT